MVEKMIGFCYSTQYCDGRGSDVAADQDRSNEIRQSYDDGSPYKTNNIGLANHSADVLDETDPSHCALVVNANVYILGDKYNIPALKNLAARKYAEIVKNHWNGPKFGESAQLVYNNIVSKEDKLRDVIVEAARLNIKELRDRGEFMEQLRQHADLSADILNAVLTKGTTEESSATQCRYCQSRNIAVIRTSYTRRCKDCGNSWTT
jgi:hypothetical protein